MNQQQYQIQKAKAFLDRGVAIFAKACFGHPSPSKRQKEPAAILYGRVEPGGMVNITTKQPLATPYYSLNQQFGSYDLYRTSIDASGPLTIDDTLLYRMNASFQSNNSFRDLVSNENIFLVPIIKWNISPPYPSDPGNGIPTCSVQLR